MERQKKNIAGIVRDLIQPVADEMEYILWDVEYVKEGAEMVLRITIDKDGDEGISIDDCERLHRAIDPILDEADPIENSYRLEVSSPGVERTLSRPEHFQKCLGEEVEVRLYAPLHGQKKIVGTLVGADDNTITIAVGEENVTLENQQWAKVTTVFAW